MNGSNRDSQLQQELRDLSERVLQLEARVKALEGTTLAPVPQKISDARELESRVGLTWVNRIGAVTLAIGVLFLFNYAVEKQWITIWGRIILGLIAGILMVASSEWLAVRGQKVFSQGVYGSGVAVAYIAIYFGFDEYRTHHGTVTTALCVLAGIFALCFYLAIRWTRRLVFTFNLCWALIAAALLLHPKHPNGFAAFALALAALHWIASSRAPLPRSGQNTVYALGHAALVAAVVQWLVTWIANHVQPANRLDVTSESSSFLLACYAVVMIALGFVKGRALDRFLGLVAFGLVILKLYLYDIWQLDRFYRISAFVALGALLLGASYIYSRWKNKLDVLLTGKAD